MKREISLTDLNQIDSMVKLGRINEAKTSLVQISPTDVPRSLAVNFSNLARRIGANHWGLRVLGPIVYKHFPGVIPNADECATYAALLIKLGVFREASSLLHQTQQTTPLCHLYRAYLSIAQWNHAKAIPDLKSYIEQTTDPYAVATAQMNLTACYISCGHYNVALTLVSRLSELASKNGWALFKINSTELMLRILALLGTRAPAGLESKVQQNLLQLGKLNTTYELFVEKWKMILKINRGEFKTQDEITFNSLKRKAAEISHYETLRDLDLHWAILKKDCNLARKVFFGTPYESYRSRILKDFPQLNKRDCFLWKNEQISLIEHKTFAVASAQLQGREIFKHQSLFHKTLLTLTEDFYRPLPIGRLFSSVYINEVFNPIHSTIKVYKLLQRFQKQLDEYQIELRYSLKGGEVTIKPSDQVALLVPAYSKVLEKPRIVKKAFGVLVLIQRHFKLSSFTSSQLAKLMGTSQRTAQKTLAILCQHSKVKVSGKSREIRYKCA